MMSKFFPLLSCLLLLACTGSRAQHRIRKSAVREIQLPPDIAYYDNQFSSLYLVRDRLFLMSECRLEDKRPAFVAYADLKDMDKQLQDSGYSVPFHRIYLQQLEVVRQILKQRNQNYEGLEAMAIGNDGTYYFTIETDTPSDSCYVIKGYVSDSSIRIDTGHLVGIAKPTDRRGRHIYNAGYEALEIRDGQLLAIFEYNYFPEKNMLIKLDTALTPPALRSYSLEKIPFRITDVSWDQKRKALWAINYFYDGGGGDTIYRLPETDEDFPLTQKNGRYNSYSRIVQITEKKGRYAYKTVASLPEAYWQYNWEGIAAYKKGWFLVNDKYTARRPYKSVLLYVPKP